MNERLQQFLAAENINQAQFADSIGVARASVSHILAGRNKPGYDFLISMMKRYPELNIEWLLSGKGKMYKNAGNAAGARGGTQSPAQINLFEDLPDFFGQELPVQPEQESVPEPQHLPKTPGETPLSAQDRDSPANTGAMEEKKQEISPEPAVRQRSAVKIVIFYDDNTFQEF